MKKPITIKIVAGGESKAKPEDCRRTIVGPGVNQPDPFPGYGGFVGFESPALLRNGTWLVGFLAGYSHYHGPSPMDYYTAEELEHVRSVGYSLEGYHAPTGARAMITRSTDQGATWSKPETLIDTPANDAHPAFRELPDGTILCSFFTAWGVSHPGDPSLAVHARLIRSFDGGFTWEREPRLLPSPFLAEETIGPIVLLRDGSILIAVNGDPPEGGPAQLGIFRSRDQAETWELLSVVKTDHDLFEPGLAELPNGRLIMVTRSEGDILWSRDGGRTWTEPERFGMRMFAPSLYCLRHGMLVCLHGSYAPGQPGLRVIFSMDGGASWIAPAPDHGFLVDHAYGYGKGMELPDGTLFITYMSTGGHRPEDARTNSVRCIRLRVREDHSGIDLLPGALHRP